MGTPSWTGGGRCLISSSSIKSSILSSSENIPVQSLMSELIIDMYSSHAPKYPVVMLLLNVPSCQELVWYGSILPTAMNMLQMSVMSFHGGVTSVQPTRWPAWSRKTTWCVAWTPRHVFKECRYLVLPNVISANCLMWTLFSHCLYTQSYSCISEVQAYS